MKPINRRFTNPLGASVPLSQSSFEEVVRELKLVPEQYKDSQQLRDWVFRHKDEKYVPSDVLKAFGFDCADD